MGIFHRLKRFRLNNKNSLYLFVLAGSYSCKSDSSSSDVDTTRVVVDNMLTITEDSTETRIRVVANNNNLLVSAVEEAENGEVSVDNGYILYTPNANFEGSETLRYSISNSNGETSTAQLIVTVTGINDPAVITGVVTGSITEGDTESMFWEFYLLLISIMIILGIFQTFSLENLLIMEDIILCLIIIGIIF